MVIPTNIFEETQSLFDSRGTYNRVWLDRLFAFVLGAMGFYGLYMQGTPHPPKAATVAYGLLAMAFYYFIKSLWRGPHFIVTAEGIKLRKLFGMDYANWNSIGEITGENLGGSMLDYVHHPERAVGSYSLPLRRHWVVIPITGNQASSGLIERRILRIALEGTESNKYVQALNACRAAALGRH